MHGQRLLARPAVPYQRRTRDVDGLFHHIQLAQARPARIRIGNTVKKTVVLVAYILDVAQPVVGQAQTSVFQRGAHAAAAVMADHHDMAHLEHVNRKLDHRQAVQIGMHHHVGDIAVNKNLARQ